ncbi:p-loop containing nucleoside triphosphate hydrolase protein [Mycena sanguinolenta]|uniref:p-loop containing nucleoside triphosphate hydrolase protein n=1 Tax=Mycena sanguinolenta TaxID=230812 RepID=A0A8H7CUE9_9AGAR|nr:p-loop containing nucleoside triphosphate hydrolase protein [Mycena sanguinolenta]
MDHELAFLATATPVEEQTDANFLHHQLITSPLLTYSAIKHNTADFPSRGLLGMSAGDRVYVNTNAPSSAVICGVQGSGKSHTVSCFLECALIPDPRVGQLPEPLSALVFHFDTQDSGRPCEAAFISSPAAQHTTSTLPQVTVLCSPSNINGRRRAYASLPQVRVEPLYLSEKDLTVDRMLAIMACDNLDTMPLYMHTALHIIRTMGIDAFSYAEFKQRIRAERLNPAQRAMIELRLQLLDAFVPPGAHEIGAYFSAGGLVLVDLTDPFLDGLTASVLFDIVLGAFIQWQTTCGKLVVLDEAHKYLTNSDSARLTQSVSNIIRLQRHLAARVIIATQEPTVVPPTILDLASTIMCHRFSSPAWCAHLARHVSAGTGSDSASWYEQVMSLPTGDALVFSPAAVITADERGGVSVLGRDHLKLRVRPRLTLDGGASQLAVGRSLPSASSSSVTASPLMRTSLPLDSHKHIPRDAQTSSSAASSLLTPMFSPTNPYTFYPH